MDLISILIAQKNKRKNTDEQSQSRKIYLIKRNDNNKKIF